MCEEKAKKGEYAETAEWHDINSPEQYGYVCSACGCRVWTMSKTCPECGRKMSYNGYAL